MCHSTEVLEVGEQRVVMALMMDRKPVAAGPRASTGSAASSQLSHVHVLTPPLEVCSAFSGKMACDIYLIVGKCPLLVLVTQAIHPTFGSVMFWWPGKQGPVQPS